jgi:hypothetical protein
VLCAVVPSLSTAARRRRIRGGAAQEAASKPLLDALPSGDPGAVSAADDSTEADGTIEETSSALACGRALNESCSSSLRCCRGLACTAYSYYGRCSCGTEYTVNYPERTTSSASCTGSAAWIRRYRRGCAANGAWNLAANACGDGVSVPAYQIETWTVLICGKVFC